MKKFLQQNNLTNIFSKFSSGAIEAIYFGQTKNLKIFTDGANAVIAENIDEAINIFEEHVGMYYEEFYYYSTNKHSIKYWHEKEYDPEKFLSISDRDTGETITKTYKEWVEETGKGFLFTTDF